MVKQDWLGKEPGLGLKAYGGSQLVIKYQCLSWDLCTVKYLMLQPARLLLPSSYPLRSLLHS